MLNGIPVVPDPAPESSGCLSELVVSAIYEGIVVLAIQILHIFSHPNSELDYKMINCYQLIASSPWKNAQNASTGGIGIELQKIY